MCATPAIADPSECVIDELAGQWLACAFVAFAPLSLPAFLLCLRAVPAVRYLEALADLLAETSCLAAWA